MDVTLSDLNALGNEIKNIRDDINKHKIAMADLQEFLDQKENEFIQKLKDNGMEKYFIPDVGTAYVSTRFTYKVPKTPEEREAFFSYLKQKGVYNDMVTVHSQTLNSWAKAEIDAAITNGASDFKVPGLGDPSMYETLNIRKA